MPADETRARQEAFERALRLKRQAPVTHQGPGTPAGRSSDGQVLCPYCLEHIQLDLAQLFVTDSRMQYKPLDVSTIGNALRRQDVMRGAVPGRSHRGPGLPEHFIPVPYLTYGRPLTVAMVGQSSTGKSHLLTQMIAEITDGGLEPFGLKWQSVNPEQHARFVRERVQPLRNGKVLDHTGALGLDGFARFVESLLITDAHGQVRPVAFFDLGGEDLVADAALRFLLGIDALIFVVDPALALPLPHLDHARERWGVEVNRDGDLAFGTVLDRLPKNRPRSSGRGRRDGARQGEPPAVPAARRPVAGPGTGHLARPERTREESQGRVRAAATARRAGLAAPLRRDPPQVHPACRVGHRRPGGTGSPAGAGPRRVLEPLLALLALHGMVEVPGGAEAFAVGEAPRSRRCRRREAADRGAVGAAGSARGEAK